MSLDNIAITITGTPDQLAPITNHLTNGGHTIRLVDLPDMLLECDMTGRRSPRVDGPGPLLVDFSINDVDVTSPSWVVTGITADGEDVPVVAEPAEPAEPAVSTCRECGCTDDRACPGGCWWANDDRDLCTRCAVEEPVSAAVGIDMLAAELAAADSAAESVEEVGDVGLGDDPTGELLVGSAPPASSTVRPDILDDTAAPLTERIAALLLANPDREWAAAQVGEHITDARNTGVIGSTLNNLVMSGRINRSGRGRYTAPAPIDPTEFEDDDDADDEPVPLSTPAKAVLEFLRSDAGAWTVDGLLSEFPQESSISMRSYLTSLRTRGLVEHKPASDIHSAATYRAVPA